MAGGLTKGGNILTDKGGNTMEEMHVTMNVEVPGWGILTGEFTQNRHGWLCKEINGIRWDYTESVQSAKESPERAAEMLLENFGYTDCD